MSTCCVCNRERKDGKTLELSEVEKAYLAKASKNVPDTLFYCKPCWAIVTDKRQGAQLIKGLVQTELARFGVRGSSQIADKFYKLLIDRAKKGPIS